MPSLRHLQQLETDLYKQMIVSKHPFPIQGGCRKIVKRYETNNEIVNFEMLVMFIVEQTRQASHPVYSVEAFAELETKKKRQTLADFNRDTVWANQSSERQNLWLHLLNHPLPTHQIQVLAT